MQQTPLVPYNERYIRKNNKTNLDIDFLNWMTEIENYVYSQINLNLDDLPDELYRINFDKGTTPKEMAKIVVDNFNHTDV